VTDKPVAVGYVVAGRDDLSDLSAEQACDFVLGGRKVVRFATEPEERVLDWSGVSLAQRDVGERPSVVPANVLRDQEAHLANQLRERDNVAADGR